MKRKIKELKATVIVVNFNNAKYIKKCLDSILYQDYKNIEIIVIDDNSTDNSLSVIKKYKKKVNLIKKKDKIGVPSFDQMKAFQKGYAKSKGEVIFLLDSDDYFHKKKISIIMNKFMINKDNKIIYDLPIKKYSKKEKNIKMKKKFFETYWPYLPPTSCIAIKKSEFKSVIRLINFKYYPDIWFDFRIGIVSKYIFNQMNFINKNLTFYRQTSTNISSNFNYLSKNWWKRRNQAHSFIKFFFKRNKINYYKNIDYFFTKVVNCII